MYNNINYTYKEVLVMRYYSLINFLSDLIERLFADKEKLAYLNNVPMYCRQCEFLVICRDKSNLWKCNKGCLLLNSKGKTYRNK